MGEKILNKIKDWLRHPEQRYLIFSDDDQISQSITDLPLNLTVFTAHCRRRSQIDNVFFMEADTKSPEEWTVDHNGHLCRISTLQKVHPLQIKKTSMQCFVSKVSKRNEAPTHPFLYQLKKGC